MNVLQLIASNSYITLNKNLIKIFGLEGAAIIGTFASIHNYNEQITKDFDGWFYATYDKIEEELGLSKHVASNAIEKVIERGILIDKRVGIPCRRHFKFQEVELFNFLSLKNLTTSGAQDSRQAAEFLPPQVVEEFNCNKNTDNNKFSSLPKTATKDQLESYKKEKNYLCDFEKFWSLNQQKGWKGIQDRFARLDGFEQDFKSKNPQLYEKKPTVRDFRTVGESPEISALRNQIKFKITNSDLQYLSPLFWTNIIEKTPSGFTVFVKDERALECQEILEKLNVKIEVKNV